MSPTIIWAIAGLLLVIVEVFTTSFVLLFFGISALIVSGVKVFGLNNLPVELGIFALLGILGTIIFRTKIKNSLESSDAHITDKEKIIPITEDILAGKTGVVQYQGTRWQAVNTSSDDLISGDDAIITNIEGVKLFLRKK